MPLTSDRKVDDVDLEGNVTLIVDTNQTDTDDSYIYSLQPEKGSKFKSWKQAK